MVYLLLAFFGILAGISSSLFGFGGGIIIVPLLYHLQNTNNPYAMHIAIATSTSIIIFNALNSTYKHRQYIIWSMVHPIIIYISIGSLIGVALSSITNSIFLKWLFIVYLSYTIINSIYKKNFSTQTENKVVPISKIVQLVSGFLIGCLSVLLGIGGSIMTVPLMRKFGSNMKSAAAIANILSIPIGLVGSIGYIISAYSKHISLGAEYLGFIYLPALVILTATGFIGVSLGSFISHSIAEKLHAKIYIGLLILVLIFMVS